MREERAPTVADRLGIAAVLMLVAAFLLAGLVALVPQGQADDRLAARDDDVEEVVAVEDDDDHDNTGNGQGGNGTATGTTQGTGPSNTNTNDTNTGTQTGNGGNGTQTQ
jgi:hypothetical protein